MLNTVYNTYKKLLIPLLWSVPNTLRNLKIHIQENLTVKFSFHLQFNGICVFKNKVKATTLYKYVPELLKLVFQCILEKQ